MFFTNQPYFILVGYMNHELRVYNKANGKLEVQEVAAAQILSVCLSEDETIVTVGCANGYILVY